MNGPVFTVGWLMVAALLAAGGPDPSRFRLTALGQGRIATIAAGRQGPAPGLASSAGNTAVLPLPSLASRLRELVEGYPLVIAAGLVAASGVGIGVVPACAGALMCVVLNVVWRQRRRLRHARKGSADLTRALAALGDELGAGATTSAAFSAVAATSGRYGGELGAAGVAAGEGDDLCRPLSAHPELRVLGAACSVASGIGSELRPVLAILASDLSAAQQTRDAVSSVLAGPMTSAMLLATLPVVGLAMGAGMGARPIFVLLHTGAGLTALCLGMALEAAGLLWTMLIVRLASP